MNKRIKSKNAVMILAIINVIVFLLQVFAEQQGFYDLVLENFALIPLFVAKGYIFQILTYMFLHGGFFHIFINMYALIIFGTAIEQTWGAKKFLKYYFFTGIGAGLCIFIMNYFVFPELMIRRTIGASGAVFGILLAFGVLFPDSIILLFFVIPMKAKYIVILYGGFELYCFFSQANLGISHVGHLGGLLFGIIYFALIDKKSRKASKKIRAKAISAITKQITKQASANEAKREDINKLSAILNKLEQKDSLSDSDCQIINYYGIMNDGKNNEEDENLCDSSDFNNSDMYCLKCENYIKCILRKINSIIVYNGNSKNNT